MSKSLSHTAFVTMYSRIFTDIPYCKYIYEQAYDLRDKSQVPFLPIEDKKPFLAPELEYRYKLIDKVLSESDFDTIVEIGSGFSPRGLIYSNMGVDYLEIELDDIINIKKNIYKSMLINNRRIEHSPIMISGDILDSVTWRKIHEHINGRNTIFVNEGLLRYFNKNQKEYVGNNISNLIRINGGKWVTADVTLAKLIESQRTLVFKEGSPINDLILNSCSDHTFESLPEAKRFFEKITNLTTRVHKEELKQSFSGQILGLTENEISKLTEYVYVFEMVSG